MCLKKYILTLKGSKMEYIEYLTKIGFYGLVIILAEILKWWAALMVTGIIKLWIGR